MEDVTKIIGIALIALLMVIFIKQYRPEFTIYISILSGILILAVSVDKLVNIINLLKDISNKSGINSGFINILIKMTGIAILSEFAINICKDAGESAIANKLEIGTKAIVISMSIPIIYNLLDVILKLLPNN